MAHPKKRYRKWPRKTRLVPIPRRPPTLRAVAASRQLPKWQPDPQVLPHLFQLVIQQHLLPQNLKKEALWLACTTKHVYHSLFAETFETFLWKEEEGDIREIVYDRKFAAFIKDDPRCAVVKSVLSLSSRNLAHSLDLGILSHPKKSARCGWER